MYGKILLALIVLALVAFMVLSAYPYVGPPGWEAQRRCREIGYQSYSYKDGQYFCYGKGEYLP